MALVPAAQIKENIMSEREWRCKQCETLLGIERGGKLYLKYKKAHFVVQGAVLAVCRSCSELNEMATPSPPVCDGPRAASPHLQVVSAR